MTKPTIHLNGTSATSLAEAYEKAATAVSAALEAVYEAGPNGRDYYPQGPAALRSATAEHEARLASLRGVRDELMQLCEHCIDSAGRR